MSYSCWIDKEFKTYYSDSSKNGLRLVFGNGVLDSTKQQIACFVSFLRKHYFFPIRCYIHFTNNYRYYSSNPQKKYCYGVFFEPSEINRKYPAIYLPVKQRNANEIESVLFGLTKLLTFYFQWYFFDNKNRTERSLTMEANEYARYLVEDYLQSSSNKSDFSEEKGII